MIYIYDYLNILNDIFNTSLYKNYDVSNKMLCSIYINNVYIDDNNNNIENIYLPLMNNYLLSHYSK
jgi:hypothetical protein